MNSILCEVETESIKKKKKPYLRPLFASFYLEGQDLTPEQSL
jgi:hypothetical protein